MKILVTAAAVVLLAGAAHAQVPPSALVPPVNTLTRDLNSGPPAPATYLVPAPGTAPGPAPAPVLASPVATPVISMPRPAPNPVPAPATVPPMRAVAPVPVVSPVQPFAREPVAIPVRVTPIPTAPVPQPRMIPITPPAAAAVPTTLLPPATPGATPRPAPTVALEAVVAPAAPPPAPSITVLDGTARAALPFTADLPAGFEIVTARPGPDFRIYTIRRGGQSFVMVYTGPASQFPIYTGQMVEAGGRASILSTEDGVRHAVEHLFQRPAVPSEIHIWTMSLDGADRDLAEQIAQSVDVR